MSSNKSSSSSPHQRARVFKPINNSTAKNIQVGTSRKEGHDFDSSSGNSNIYSDASALRKKKSANDIFDHYYFSKTYSNKFSRQINTSDKKSQKYFSFNRKEDAWSLMNSPRVRNESLEEQTSHPINTFNNAKKLIKRRPSKEILTKASETNQYFFEMIKKQKEKLPLSEIGRSALLSREDGRLKKEIDNHKLFSNLYLREGGTLLGFYEKDLQKVKESFLNEDPVTNRLILIGCDAMSLVNLERRSKFQEEFTSFLELGEFFENGATEPNPKGNRKKAVELGTWIRQMLDGIKKCQNLDSKDIFENVQIILGAAVSELTRQIGTSCNEQAILLNKIWSKNQEITTRLIMELKSLLTDFLLNNEKETKDLHAQYIKRLEKQSFEKEKLSENIEKLSEELNFLKLNQEYSKKKIEREEKEKTILSKQYQTLEKEFNRLMKIIKREEDEERERKMREKTQKDIKDSLNSYQINFQRLSKRERSYRYIEEVIDSFSEVAAMKHVRDEFLGVVEKGTSTEDLLNVIDVATGTEELIVFADKGCEVISSELVASINVDILRKHKCVGTENIKALKEMGVNTEFPDNETDEINISSLRLRSLTSLEPVERNMLTIPLPNSSPKKYNHDYFQPSVSNISLSLTPAVTEFYLNDKINSSFNTFKNEEENESSSSNDVSFNPEGRKGSSDNENISSSENEGDQENFFLTSAEGTRGKNVQSKSNKNDLISSFDNFINYLKKHQDKVEQLISPYLFYENDEKENLEVPNNSKGPENLINNPEELKNFILKLFYAHSELKTASEKVEDFISISKQRDLDKNSNDLNSSKRKNLIKDQQTASFKGSPPITKVSPSNSFSFNKIRSPMSKLTIREPSGRGFGQAISNENERFSARSSDRSSTMMIPATQEKRRFFNNVSTNYEMAVVFVSKAINFKASNKKIKSKSNLLKFIKLMYLEKIRQLKTREKGNPLHVVAYDVFFKRYNFQAIVEAKLQGLIEGALYFTNIIRVKHFLSFFGLGESTENEDFEIYVKFLEKMEETAISSETSVMYQFCKTKKSFLVISKIKEVASKLWESSMYPKLLQSFLEKIDKMKSTEVNILVNASTNIKTAVLGLDPVLALILEFNVKNREYILNNLKPVYLAGDINEDHSIGFYEFLILLRHIEKGKFTLVQATEIFYDKCDLMDKEKEEREMTFKNFSLMSFEKGLFSEASQNEFLKTLDGLSLDLLVQKWHKEKRTIEKRFSATEKLTDFHSDMIKKIESVLSQKLSEQDKLIRLKTAGLVMRLLEEDSKWSVMDMHLFEILGDEMYNLDSALFSSLRKTIMLKR